MSGRSKKAKSVAPKPFERIEIETYANPTYWLRWLESDRPSVGNGTVRIRRYRVVAELIEEPIEVLRERLLKLWRETENNHHHWEPMQRVAAELGMDKLDDEQGVDFKKRSAR